MSLGVVWKMSDALNGLMAIPNLIALILLSPIVFKLTKDYFEEERTLDHKSAN
jgi:AGCS family alanine or glycine:cation symporter